VVSWHSSRKYFFFFIIIIIIIIIIITIVIIISPLGYQRSFIFVDKEDAEHANPYKNGPLLHSEKKIGSTVFTRKSAALE